MPGKWQRHWVGFVALIASTMATLLHACPYCPRFESTLCEKLANSDAVCLVRFVSTRNGADFAVQTTKFSVVKSLPKEKTFKKDEEITIPIGVTANVGDQFLLMGQLVAGEMDWNLPIAVDELGSELAYITKAPSIESPVPERLTYFWNFLDSKIPLIANDAFGEFSRAKFNDIELWASHIERDKVREWLEDPNELLDVRRDFLGLILGLCGNDDDATFLEQKIFAPIPLHKNRLGIDGMMAGYLMLRGQPGLLKLIEKKIDSVPLELPVDDPRISELISVKRALNFLWDYRREQFLEESLRVGMRRFLGRFQYAEMAIIDLARWKDWASLDLLIAEYGRPPWETPLAKEKIVAFTLFCVQDLAGKSDAKSTDTVAKARKFLGTIDPKFVESVKKSIGSSTSVLDPVPDENLPKNVRE